MALLITTVISIYGLNPAQIESLQDLGLDLQIHQGRNFQNYPCRQRNGIKRTGLAQVLWEAPAQVDVPHQIIIES